MDGTIYPLAFTLFQVENIDMEVIKYVHGEEVKEIVCEYRTTIRKPPF